jgi:hypothetical protein
MDYFELYYAYLAWCEKDNWANMRDPNHDYMEWNHTLPQCIFGDQPIGQWLTLKQHAIASALQTLAFKERCHCGMHREHMPGVLWELCFPYYSDSSRKMQLKRSENKEHAFQTEEFRRNQSKRVSRRNRENAERGEHPMQQERNRQSQSERSRELWESEEWREKNKDSISRRAETLVQQNAIRLENGTHNFVGEEAGKRSSEMQLQRVQNGEHQWKTKEHGERVRSRLKGTKCWVNREGKLRREKEKPEGEWINARKWRDQ